MTHGSYQYITSMLHMHVLHQCSAYTCQQAIRIYCYGPKCCRVLGCQAAASIRDKSAPHYGGRALSGSSVCAHGNDYESLDTTQH